MAQPLDKLRERFSEYLAQYGITSDNIETVGMRIGLLRDFENLISEMKQEMAKKLDGVINSWEEPEFAFERTQALTDFMVKLIKEAKNIILEI